MKTNQLPEEWTMMITCLKEAHRAAIWSFWRDRFNTNHPEHIRREEVENPTRYATANFYAGKAVYMSNREQFDKIYEEQFSNTEDGDLFLAMKRVVEKELETSIENMLTQEETMGRNRYQEPDLNKEELDEDEQYVRETEDDGPDVDDIWDGDEYLGDDEFDDFDDEFEDEDDFAFDDEE